MYVPAHSDVHYFCVDIGWRLEDLPRAKDDYHIYMYLFTFMYMYTYLYVCMNIYIRMHVSLCIYIFICIFIYLTSPLVYWVECSQMVRGIGVQSEFVSYQRLKKKVLDASLFNTQHYKVRIKGKWSNLTKWVTLSPTPQCSSYWNGSIRVALDIGWAKLLIYIYILT